MHRTKCFTRNSQVIIFKDFPRFLCIYIQKRHRHSICKCVKVYYTLWELPLNQVQQFPFEMFLLFFFKMARSKGTRHPFIERNLLNFHVLLIHCTKFKRNSTPMMYILLIFLMKTAKASTSVSFVDRCV